MAWCATSPASSPCSPRHGQRAARAFVPAVDAREAALVGDVEVIPVQTLADLVNHLSGEVPIDRRILAD